MDLDLALSLDLDMCLRPPVPVPVRVLGVLIGCRPSGWEVPRLEVEEERTVHYGPPAANGQVG
jgi:hypothetical protein